MMETCPLRVVHLCTSDAQGGAAIAAQRLVKAQREAGIEATLLVLHKQTTLPYIHNIVGNSVWGKTQKNTTQALEIGIAWMGLGFQRDHLFDVSIPFAGFSLDHHPLVEKADVIHIHWYNQGFLSLNSLEKLFRLGKRTVFSLHDMWSITALCHHARSCIRYQEPSGCNNCPQWRKKFIGYDVAQHVFRVKKRLYQTYSPSFVGCSQWITDLASRSQLTTGCRTLHIPNVWDQEVFRLYHREKQRRLLHLPLETPLLLMGSARTDDPRKGFYEMVQALELFYQTDLAKKLKPRPLVFGRIAHSENFEALKPYTPIFLGYIKDPLQMARCYAAANLYIMPSLEENLPNTIIEAAGSGCPTVAFNIGGIPEIISHGTTGYIAQYRNVADFSKGMEIMLPQTLEGPLEKCSQTMLNRYNRTSIVNQFISLYKS